MRPNSPRALLLLLLSSACLAPRPFAQTPATAPDHTPVFRARARTVVVDIVVTSKKGQPIPGLPQSDFQVTEDGQPQRITSFEEHQAAHTTAAHTPPPLPPNVFTNLPQVAPDDSITLLLLDSLNTPLQDQTYVRNTMLKYLANLQPGNRLAVFTLGQRLQLIQNFTDDPELLHDAVTSLKNGTGPQSSSVLQSQTEDTAQKVLFAHIAAGPGAGPEIAAALQQFQTEQIASQTGTRAMLTLEAFQQLAHYLAGIPGRKNLVWLSGGFPLTLLPNAPLNNAPLVQRDFQDEARKTNAALAAAQVAVYPIAAEGVAVDSLYDPANQLTSTTPGGLRAEGSTSLQNDAQHRNFDHDTMDQIADSTGGHAFYNTNGFNEALAHVTEHSADYYTVYYTPTNGDQNGQFRKIRVKLASGNYTLAYRRGYFADEPERTDTPGSPRDRKPNADPLRRSMASGEPESTEIPFAMQLAAGSTQPGDAALQPAATRNTVKHFGDNPEPKGPLTPFLASFAIAARGLDFTPEADGSANSILDVALVAYNDRGQPQNWITRRLALHYTAAQFATVQSNGAQISLNLDVPTRAPHLRAGVYDRNADRTGTLEVPLNQTGSASPNSPPPQSAPTGAAKP